jgi:hypothetical protein
MANTGFLSVSDASFDGIKKNLKTFLKSKTEFSDYDFEGSNLNSLVDVLSYNTYMNSFYLNMIGSEMFLDTAQMKDSVVSHAKELNYLPRSRTSAKALVTFTINTGADTPSTVIIPENYMVRAKIDQTYLDFSTEEDIIVYNINGVYSSGPVYVYEGKLVTEYFTVGDGKKYILQSDNVDTNSLKITVIKSDIDSSNTIYSYTDTLLGLNQNSEVYFLQSYKENQYEVIFGDGVTGNKLTSGNIVKATYRSCNAELGNRVSRFAITRKIEDDKYDVTVSTNSIAVDGSEREDIDSIKYYSPRHFTTQNRTVTKDDYVNLIRNEFPQIKTVGVYGGEDAVPPQYGKVIITPIPYGTIPFISTQLKKSILSYLMTKTITTEPLIYDPEYLYLKIVTNVLFNPSLTDKTSNQLITEITKKIQEYDTNNLTEFGNDFRKSKLMALIDSTDASIVSNDTAVRMLYKITPIKGRSQRFEFTYSNAIYRPVQYEYKPLEQEVIQTSTFSYVKNNNVYQNVLIVDDGIGNLNLCYTSNGNRIIIEKAIGSVNYKTGSMAFNINPYDYTQSIDFYARPNTSDVNVNENKFLKIDYSKIIVLVSPLA